MFLKFRKIHRKTPVLESLFTKAADLKTWLNYQKLSQLLQTKLISSNKHVIDRVEDRQSTVVRTSQGKKRSFISLFGISKNSFPVVHKKKITTPLFKEKAFFKIRKFWTDMKCNLTGHVSTSSDKLYLAYLFKVNNRNTGKRFETCSKLIIKTPERHNWRRSDVFIVNFEHNFAYFCLKLGSHLSKKLVYLFQWKPFKNNDKYFSFFWKFFVLKICKLLPWLFGHVE